jgi:hypothetical protein
MMKLNFGRNVRLEKSDQEYYKKMQEIDLFKGKDLKDIFLFSFSLGVKYGQRTKLNDKYPLINATFSDAEMWIMASAIVKEVGNTEILEKMDTDGKIIAEEFANAGFQLLKKRFMEADSELAIKSIEAEIVRKIKEDG